MIGKLRWKLIIILIIILSVMLLAILGILLHGSQYGMKRASLTRLRNAWRDIRNDPGTEISQEVWEQNPTCLLVWENDSGEPETVGSHYFDLDNRAFASEVLAGIKANGDETGVLRGYSLRFLEVEEQGRVCYILTDISVELSTLRALLSLCVVIFLMAQMFFFGVSVFLAHWVVRPVGKAWEDQKRFVTDASHELKTPLTVIITNAELLRSGEYSQEEKTRFADSIYVMSRQMRGLVEELLDQARVDGVAENRRECRVDLSCLVTDAVLPFEPVYFEEGRELVSTVEEGIWVNGNGDRLCEVVEILLDNGCKYSAPGTTVELRLTRKGRSRCILSVTSQGDTMTEQECRDIFKRFYRVDKGRSMNSSYGLGLSIAQGIVTRHKGKIWAKSKDGENTFYVSLATCSQGK